jgi:uroporphyrinogen decarboxylase
MLSAVGDLIHVICQGDDLAMQDRSIVSPDLYRKHVKQFHKALYSFIRSRKKARIMHHSCGSVYELIPDLIDCGVDVLNPVQTSASNMEPEKLKREFGSELVFWGGLDIQRVLSQGTPQQVEEQVKGLRDVYGTGGGYVFTPSHNIQPDAPMMNIQTMFEAANRYR